jgi:hypothetical protein
MKIGVFTTAIALLGLGIAWQARAEPCVTLVGPGLDKIESGGRAVVCGGGDNPWTIYLEPDLGRNYGLSDGTPAQLLNFREEFWETEDRNALSVQLTQLTPHVWRIDFVLDGEIQALDDRSQHFIWARDPRDVPTDRGHQNETDMKYFRCFVTEKTFCQTTYSAVICRDYESDVFLRHEGLESEPGFFVAGEAEATPIELFATFDVINHRIDRLLENLTVHTCRKGWIKP